MCGEGEALREGAAASNPPPAFIKILCRIHHKVLGNVTVYGGAMNIRETQQLEQDPPVVHRQVTPAEIEQIIERIGARYITDLRTLSEGFRQFYEAQLAEKDEQIAELARRVEDAEREHDAFETRIRELRSTSEQYIAALQALSAGLDRQKKLTEDQQNAADAREREGTP
jgi:hypothetical protein